MNGMNFDSFFAELGIKVPDKCFENIFESAVREYQKDGVFFLCDEYIEYVDSLENCLSNCIEQVKTASRKVREKEELSVYTLFLYRAMSERKIFTRYFREFEFPEGDEIELRFLPFLVLLPTIPKLYSNLKQRNIPDDVIGATLRQFEECLYYAEEHTGKTGLLKRHFDHLQLYVDEMILNIGRLRFHMIPEIWSNILVLENSDKKVAVLFDGEEINCAGRICGTPPENENKRSFLATVSETETSFIGYSADENGNCSSELKEYPKKDWQMLLKKGDPVISVHISGNGAFTEDLCEESYARAKEIFKACYPEFEYKAFHCRSWLLDRQLQKFLSEKSNILSFQKRYTLYAGKTKGEDIFSFVFRNNSAEYKDLPEETSLQRALKKHYIDGGYIYEYEGVFI